MTVNKSHYLNLPALLLLLLGTALPAVAQGPAGAYQDLVTASDMSITDTVEGVDLQVITIEPSANHGNVDIHLITPGNGNAPNRYAIRYTPHPDFQGIDTFALELNQFLTFPYLTYLTYRVSVYPAQITLKDDFATTYIGVPITVHVLGNDQSSSGPLTLSDIAVANHGTAIINTQNQVIFTPQSGFSGIALINYVACDPSGLCKTGQLSVGVRPVGQPGNTTLQIATAKNTSTQVPLQFGGYVVWQAPAHGSVQLTGGRAFKYTPDADYAGADPFVLRRNVNGVISSITVNMKVLQTAPENKMAVNDYIFTPVGTPVTFNVRQNDLGSLQVSQWGSPGTGGFLSNTMPNGQVTFTPDPDFTGAAVFQYALGNGLEDFIETATVNVVVSNLNPAYDTFHLATSVGAPFVIDYPVPFEIYDFEINQLPGHGVCHFYPGYTTQIIGGQSVSGNNLLVYYPNPGYSGADFFEINYCLAANGQCKNTVVQMQVAGSTTQHCMQDCVWPGDVNADGIVNNKDLLSLGFCMGKEGAPRSGGSTGWRAQPGSNWSDPYVPLHTDLKHADADGNGHITQSDAAVIEQHYGHTDNLVPASPLTKKGLPFFFTLLTPNAGVGDLVEVEVALGSASEPVINLYGLTFDALLSSNIVDSAFKMEFYNNSWINLNSPFLSLGVSPAPGRLESAFTRTNGQPVSGFGVIGKFSFVIIDIVDVGRPEDFLYFNLTMSNASFQWGDGVLTNGSNYELKVPLNGSAERAVPPTETSPSPLRVYPSPASQMVQVLLENGDQLQSVTLYDLNCRVVRQLNGLSTDRTTLDVSNLPSGLYIVSAQTTGGTSARKIEVVNREW